MNSFIKWAGSKKQLLPVITDQLPENYSRYIEPFAGSASLFFQLMPKQAILGDINKELIDTYSIIKTNIEGVISQLYQLKKSKKNYYHLRGINPEKLKEEEAAARFIYLNRFCFNGLYRTNKLGIFNVPYGEHK